MSEIDIPAPPETAPEPIPAPAEELAKAPPPTAIGTAQVAVLNHELVDAIYDAQDSGRKAPSGANLVISNESQTTMATVVLEALFYDREGTVVETLKHKITDLGPGRSRGILISSHEYEPGRVASYQVRVVRTISAEVERLQLRRFEVQTMETGEEVVHGLVKNLSNVTMDAAVVVSFLDVDKEILGTRVVLVRGIPPDTVKPYEVTFKPEEGDTVISCDFRVGEIAG